MRPGPARRGSWALALALAAGCRTPAPAPLPAPDAPSVRFLVTFDDGPSARAERNPTLRILDALDDNGVQPGVRGIFFVQTHHPRGGGAPRGRRVMREIHERGHLLGLHSISPEGHVAHPALGDGELEERLRDAMALIRSKTGRDPRLVRPPFGARDERTRRAYEAHGLDFVLCDLRAKDGIIYGFTASPRRRGHFRRSLARVRDRLPPGGPGGEPYPLLVTFHDLNPYTARKMGEYLSILVEESGRVGLRLSDPPFYDCAEAAGRAASARRIPPPGP